MNRKYVLDASALLAIVLDEQGQDRVSVILDDSVIHAINLAEVIGRLIRSGMPAESAATAIRRLHLETHQDFSTAQAELCGVLLGTRRDLGLSLGDCVCLTTAVSLDTIAVTADRRWNELHGTLLQGHPIQVELIR